MEKSQKKLRIGSRESKLAVIQSQIIMQKIKAAYPEIELELITMKTTGDIILDRTLDKIGGKGLFVKELDHALREGVIDLAVHSLKDMPAETPEDLPIVAYSQREDPRDALIFPEGITTLIQKKPIGCSSARRKVQVQQIYSSITIEPVRGNVVTRLKKLDEGQFGALILASAGLKRLGLQERISYYFSPQEMIPAAGQGILGVQGRKGENPQFLGVVMDQESESAALAEREFIQTLDGGCSAPIAAYAEIFGDELRLSGLYVHEETGLKAQGTLNGKRTEARKLGYLLAKRLLKEASQNG